MVLAVPKANGTYDSCTQKIYKTAATKGKGRYKSNHVSYKGDDSHSNSRQSPQQRQPHLQFQSVELTADFLKRFGKKLNGSRKREIQIQKRQWQLQKETAVAKGNSTYETKRQLQEAKAAHTQIPVEGRKSTGRTCKHVTISSSSSSSSTHYLPPKTRLPGLEIGGKPPNMAVYNAPPGTKCVHRPMELNGYGRCSWTRRAERWCLAWRARGRAYPGAATAEYVSANAPTAFCPRARVITVPLVISRCRT